MKRLIVALMVLSLSGCALFETKVETKYEVLVQTKYVPVGIDNTFFDKGESLKKIDVSASTQKDAAVYVADLYGGYVQRGVKLDSAKAENAAKLADIEAKNVAEAKRVKEITDQKK